MKAVMLHSPAGPAADGSMHIEFAHENVGDGGTEEFPQGHKAGYEDHEGSDAESDTFTEPEVRRPIFQAAVKQLLNSISGSGNAAEYLILIIFRQGAFIHPHDLEEELEDDRFEEAVIWPGACSYPLNPLSNLFLKYPFHFQE